MQTTSRTGSAWLLALLLGLTAAACATRTGSLRVVSSDSQPRTLDSELRAATPPGNSQIETKPSQGSSKTKLQVTYARLPLHFEPNQGQTDERVHFLSRGRGYTLFLTATEAVLALRKPRRDSQDSFPLVPDSLSSPPPLRGKTLPFLSSPLAGEDKGEGDRASDPEPLGQTVLRMQLVAANPNPRVAGQEELPGKVNYFIGKDQEKWRTDIPTFAKVQYKDVYPGVDLGYYGNQGQLEYDLVIAPGADPNVIRLAFQDRAGQDLPLQINTNGNLVLSPTGGEVHLLKPHIYQELDGVKQPIAGRYVLLGSKVANSEQKTVGFEVATYDVSKPLIIDPVLSYSTYLGGSSGEGIQNDFDNGGIAVDIAGDAYVVGFTGSSDFPLSSSPPQNFHGGTFVTKFDATGSVIVYSAFLDNTDAGFGRGIAVDTAGNAYVIGHTHSADFPTVNPFQPSYGGDGDAFVAKLNETGSALIYSTYLGGLSEDSGNAIAVDATGNAYVTGYTTSPDFPVVNPIQASRGGDRDAFVAKLNAAGSALDYSTYLGGSVDVFSHNTAWDEGRGVAVDSSGNAYVAGITVSFRQTCLTSPLDAQ